MPAKAAAVRQRRVRWNPNICSSPPWVFVSDGRRYSDPGRETEPLLLDGLRRLEYRGYDSAGLATVTGRRLHLRKKAGRVGILGDLLRDRPAPGCLGISHTRWATHGPATDGNAHPHVAGDGENAVAVVHN